MIVFYLFTIFVTKSNQLEQNHWKFWFFYQQYVFISPHRIRCSQILFFHIMGWMQSKYVDRYENPQENIHHRHWTLFIHSLSQYNNKSNFCHLTSLLFSLFLHCFIDSFYWFVTCFFSVKSNYVLSQRI